MMLYFDPLHDMTYDVPEDGVYPSAAFPAIRWRHSDQILPHVFGSLPQPGEQLLDVGGGNGVLALDYWRTRTGKAPMIYDIWDGYQHAHPGPFIQGDARDLTKRYSVGHFPWVQCTEMLEHVEKPAGRVIIANLKTIAARGLYITTPCGFDYQPEEAQGNPHQVHVSGWEPDEIAGAGFEVLINGPEAVHQFKEKEQTYARPQIIAWRGEGLPTAKEIAREL
jgi:hypothetical protein